MTRGFHSLMRPAGLVAAALVVCAWPRSAEACSCAQLSVCASLPHVDAIFVARTEVLTFTGSSQLTRLHISDVFKGTMPRTLDVLATGLGGSCDYEFMAGASHLIYAHRDRTGVWKVSLCSRTTTVDRAGNDFAALAAMRETPIKTALAGRLDPARVQRYCDSTRRRE